MNKAEELAKTYMAGARSNYQRDGVLMPVLAFHGGPHEIAVQLRQSDIFPSDQLVMLTAMFSTVVPATHVVVVVETWMRQWPEADGPVGLERGALERMHEAGDPDVHTGLVVTVVDTKHLRSSQAWSIDVDAGTEPKRFDVLGDLDKGSMLDRVYAAYHAEPNDPPPPGTTWQMLAGLAKYAGFIDAAVDYAAEEKN